LPVTYDEARHLVAQHTDVYRDRHEAFRMLRKYWHGDYWNMADSESRGVVSIFRDLVANQSDVGPDLKLVHNVIQQVCVKYQTFLSPLPMIRVWVDPPETDTRRAQATRKERFLYGCWQMGNMDKIFTKIGWYLPLMGDCFLGIHPDFDKRLPTPLVRSPEFAYPIPGFDKQDEQAIVFKWKIAESVAARNFSEYALPVEQMRQDRQGKFKRGQASDPMVEIMEYSDCEEWHRWLAYTFPASKREPETVQAQEINGVVHNFGFNLFQHLKFIDVPDEVWGHGAVEQAINLNEMGNALYSLMFQSVLENVFPRLVLIDPAKAPEEIETGPGAVIPINAGGAVEWLHPPVQAIGMQQQFSGMNDHNIKEVSGMSEAQFGQSPATSIVTGKAVNELQGAGSGNMVELVQGVGIGNGIVTWNEHCIEITRRLWRDDTISLFGASYRSFTDLVPQRFALSIKGKELVGSPRNDVIFAPAMNPHEKLVMNLQALGAGIIPKKQVREQMGEPDNDAIVEQIFAETVEEAVLGAYLMELQGDPTPGTALNVEQEATSYLAGKTPRPVGPGGAPHPMAMSGPPQAGLPAAPPQGALPSGPPAPTGPGPAGAAPAPNGGGPAAPQGTQSINVQEAITAFQGLQGITGRVFLVGEIVERGETSQDIEVMVTEPADKQAIASQLPQYTGRLTFHNITGEPSERFVEVTPGANASAPGLSGPPSPQALAGIGIQ
jgi:hypothetical protein